MNIDYRKLSEDFTALENSCRKILRGLQNKAEKARQTLVGVKDSSEFASHVYDCARNLDTRLISAQNDLAYDLADFNKFKRRVENFEAEVELVVKGAAEAVKSA